MHSGFSYTQEYTHVFYFFLFFEIDLVGRSFFLLFELNHERKRGPLSHECECICVCGGV